MSGVTVDSKCVEEWNKQKLKKAYKFVMYKLSADFSTVVVEKTSCEGYDKFYESLPDKECRYATVDVPNPNPNLSDKLIFFLWAPEDAPVKDKMVYASSKDNFCKKLEGIAKVIQANDKTEATLQAVTEKLS